MHHLRILTAFAALATAAALAGCGQYGLRGDRGLSSPPERMAYPNINEVPASGRPARSASEQEALKSRLLAAKPRTARPPRPFQAPKLRDARPPRPFDPAHGGD